jgi:hypothetical protein
MGRGAPKGNAGAARRGAPTSAAQIRKAAVAGFSRKKKSAAVAKRSSRHVTKTGRKKVRRPTPAPQRDVHVKTLDPLAVCGPHTSVKHLFRVREHIDGVRTNHLVFYDKHGWYCEHGRGCHAVTIVRRANPRITD